MSQIPEVLADLRFAENELKVAIWANDLDAAQAWLAESIRLRAELAYLGVDVTEVW